MCDMRLSRRFRSVTAASLVALLLVLATGVPSHHHEQPSSPDTLGVLTPDDHSHGTILVEQGDRAPRGGPEILVAVGPTIEPTPSYETPVRVTPEDTVRPRERAPPTNQSPRAPPHLS